ncbi:MAG TPA: nucleotide exchange factor GrpE [Solirubrobacterales bacterium]|nr:nucleotide exchange factor GrpE [Solirubrobacterales bacterium]
MTEEPRPAGPIGAGDPPPLPVAKASSGEVPPTPPPAGEAVSADLDALLADVQRERDEYLDLAKRTKADFENYRKRMTAEVEAAGVRGKAELVAGLLDVIDNLERALAATGIDPDAEQQPEEPLAQGILLTYRELCSALQRAGVESDDPAGEKFDPAQHEALQKLPADGAESGTVLEVLQKGYRMNDQLIRPARVVVSE